MTVALLWVIRLLFIYFIIRFALSALGLSRKNQGPQQGSKKPLERFDDKNKNISDGDFKEL
jgi:hypothetical protein